MEINSTPPRDAAKPVPQEPASDVPSVDLPNRNPSAWAQVAKYSAIGLTVPSHIFAGWLIGTILDRVFSTGYLHIVFLLLGVFSGFVEMIKLASRNPD